MEVLYDNADTISIDTLSLEEVVEQEKVEREREIEELNKLSDKVRHLHTDLLYYRHINSRKGAACYETWRTLVKQVGRGPNTWRDLGGLLGISNDDLDYIMNSVKDDPADVVLKVFVQNEKATLDKVLEAFVKMKRYDILKKMESPLTKLSQCFNIEDSGYHSCEKEGQREIISFKKYMTNDLPPVLNKNMVIKDKEPNRPKKPTQRSPIKDCEKKLYNNRPILFLTFAEDGFDTAQNLQNYVENWIDMSDVIVITLNDRKEEVYHNPEKCIREYFERADYVVPIITSQYLNAIKSHMAAIPSTADNMDFKYVTFIYSLITNYYIHGTGCLNKKVRSVLPQNVDMNVLMNVSTYPALLPWTNELDFNEQFKAFLKKEYS